MVCFCMSVCLSTGWYPSYKLCCHLGSTLSLLFSHDQQWPTGGCVGIKFQPARGPTTETNENSVALTDCWSNFPPSTGNFIHRPLLLLLLYLSQPRIQFLFVLWGSSSVLRSRRFPSVGNTRPFLHLYYNPVRMKLLWHMQQRQR